MIPLECAKTGSCNLNTVTCNPHFSLEIHVKNYGIFFAPHLQSLLPHIWRDRYTASSLVQDAPGVTDFSNQKLHPKIWAKDCQTHKNSDPFEIFWSKLDEKINFGAKWSDGAKIISKPKSVVIVHNLTKSWKTTMERQEIFTTPKKMGKPQKIIQKRASKSLNK